uniref:Uncharacterized protein n=1 Tax=Arundo donax TaxID=35708 RepID=A0A0A9H4T0_ARUDO
MACISGDAPLE